MPLLLVLALVAVCYPFPWQPLIPLGFWDQTKVMLGLVSFNLSLASFLSWRVVRALDYPVRDARYRAVQRFHFARKFLGYWNVLSTGAVITLGWGWAVWNHVRVDGPNGPVLAPLAELLLPAPYFLTLFFNWAIYWYAETQIEIARGHQRYWPLLNYWGFQFRKFLIVVMLPVLLMTSFQGVNRLLPQLTGTSWFQTLGLIGMLMLMLILPRFIKVALGWQAFPNGPLRDHLEGTAQRLGIVYTDLLLWPTSGSMVNAMVSGMVRWARYIVFTDKILDHMTPEELDAIVGHELGHVRYYHIPYYTLFFMVSALASACALAAIPNHFGWTLQSFPEEIVPWLALPMFALMAGYYFIFFGMLSRRCERQADIFGSRAGSCTDPDCHGHDATTVLAPRGQALCRTGVLTMIAALDKVGVLNGYTSGGNPTLWQRLVQWFQAWQHGPIRARIAFLERLAEHPELAARHDRHVRWFRIGLMLVLLGTIALSARLMGWSEFAKLF